MNIHDNIFFLKISYISKFLLLIFFLLSYKILIIKRYKNKNINGNFRLYDYFKYPQISIIIPNIDKFEYNSKDILKLIMSLKYQTLNNIEIILTSSKKKFKEYKTLKNLCLSDKRIKIKIIKRKKSINNLFTLMKLLKGKFVLLLYKYPNFKSNDFENFYNFTKGKIKNIYEFKIGNQPLFLIKSKVLSDINDNNIKFNKFSDLIKYITLLPEPQLNYISIALAINNYYTSLAYVCMTSVLYTKNINSYISFYLVITREFTQKNIQFLKSLYEQYDYFNITILEIDNRYDKAFTSRHLTKEAYFRCSLGELIPYLNKIIYLDTDVIVFKDLNNLFNMNFNNKMILGQPVRLKNNSKTYSFSINSGILLLNLKKMREINMDKKALNILINKKAKYNYHDQDLLNKNFRKYLGIYPPENHARPFNDSESIKFNNKSGNFYNNDYFLFSWKYPTARHYYGSYKPYYLKINNDKYLEDWWYFARLSKYFVGKTQNINNIFNYTI